MSTKFAPRNKMILVQAIDDPLASKTDDPNEIVVVRQGMATGCGLVIAVAPDCTFAKPDMVVYHDKDQARAILLEDGQLFGLVHEELLFGDLPPASVEVTAHKIKPTKEQVEARMKQARQQRGDGDIVVPGPQTVRSRLNGGRR